MREMPSASSMFMISLAFLLGALLLYWLYRWLAEKNNEFRIGGFATKTAGVFSGMSALCSISFFATGLVLALGIRYGWF